MGKILDFFPYNLDTTLVGRIQLKDTTPKKLFFLYHISEDSSVGSQYFFFHVKKNHTNSRKINYHLLICKIKSKDPLPVHVSKEIPGGSKNGAGLASSRRPVEQQVGDVGPLKALFEDSDNFVLNVTHSHTVRHTG